MEIEKDGQKDYLVFGRMPSAGGLPACIVNCLLLPVFQSEENA